MNKNESAFPQGKAVGTIAVIEGGMTLRDYFAAKAMAAMIANPHLSERWGVAPNQIAGEAFQYADEMLLARSAP